MRALWAASTGAVTASALVGVLLGAYLHEQGVNERLTSTNRTPVTSVHTQVSTVTVLPSLLLPTPTSEPGGPSAELAAESTTWGSEEIAVVQLPQSTTPVEPPSPTTAAPTTAAPTTAAPTTAAPTAIPPASSSQPRARAADLTP